LSLFSLELALWRLLRVQVYLMNHARRWWPMFDHTSTSTHQYLTSQQLSRRWNLHPITLRRWRAERKITATRFGRGVRFAISEIERFERESIESFR
jgi:excisionase family DNA binding protein